MNNYSVREILALAIGVWLFFTASAKAQTAGEVINLAGVDAYCLNDPTQLSALQRERATLADRFHRNVAIIALPRNEAEPLTRGPGTVLGCRVCGELVE